MSNNFGIKNILVNINKAEQGQALTEIIVVFPVLLILLSGMFTPFFLMHQKYTEITSFHSALMSQAVISKEERVQAKWDIPNINTKEMYEKAINAAKEIDSDKTLLTDKISKQHVGYASPFLEKYPLWEKRKYLAASSYKWLRFSTGYNYFCKNMGCISLNTSEANGWFNENKIMAPSEYKTFKKEIKNIKIATAAVQGGICLAEFCAKNGANPIICGLGVGATTLKWLISSDYSLCPATEKTIINLRAGLFKSIESRLEYVKSSETTTVASVSLLAARP